MYPKAYGKELAGWLTWRRQQADDSEQNSPEVVVVAGKTANAMKTTEIGEVCNIFKAFPACTLVGAHRRVWRVLGKFPCWCRPGEREHHRHEKNWNNTQTLTPIVPIK